MRFVVAVPARMESSRLPGKVLADIGGKPMLQRVLERCALAHRPCSVVLCTDNDDLMRAAESWGFPALATSPACDSGSQRIASVLEAIVALAGPRSEADRSEADRSAAEPTAAGPTAAGPSAAGITAAGHPVAANAAPDTVADLAETVIINVQGDQPFLDPRLIDALAGEFEARLPVPEVLTPVYRLGAERLHDPNVVKTLVTSGGQALYFSRSAIPHVRGVDPADWHAHAPYWGHVGLYGYRADVLARWESLPDSPLEAIEKLEQLRLLEAGIRIGTFAVSGESLSVDTADQLEQARALAAAGA